MFTKKLAVIATIAAVSAFLAVAPKAFAEESTGDKVKQDANEMKTGAKKMGREASDKTCEMVNGKMQCAGKKMKHAVENTTDSAKDKVNKAADETKK